MTVFTIALPAVLAATAASLDEQGPRALARRLKELRLRHGLSQEGLAEYASAGRLNVTVSVDTVRALERARKLPVRRPAKGHFALEAVAEALHVDLGELLRECFSSKELRSSAFSRMAPIESSEPARADLVGAMSLEQFIKWLPAEGDQLQNLAEALSLRNAMAFAYIFALERAFPSYEMAVLNFLPVIFLDATEIADWADGMALDGPDRDTFLRLVADYQRHFRALALEGSKRYKLVLSKRILHDDMLARERKDASRILQDVVYILGAAPRFEMVLLDNVGPIVEFEVLSRHPIIPSSLDSTISLMIRQTRTGVRQVEYSLVPMPHSFAALQADISRIEHYWSVALDQYRADGRGGYWTSPTGATIELLNELAQSFE